MNRRFASRRGHGRCCQYGVFGGRGRGRHRLFGNVVDTGILLRRRQRRLLLQPFLLLWVRKTAETCHDAAVDLDELLVRVRHRRQKRICEQICCRGPRGTLTDQLQDECTCTLVLYVVETVGELALRERGMETLTFVTFT